MMSQTLLAGLLALSVFLFGCTALSPSLDDTGAMEDDALQKGEVMEEDAIQKDDALQKDAMLGGPFYEPFTQERYDAARAEGKTILVEFYANWCPVCAFQKPKIEAAFNEITNPDIVGFQVNYNDSETDDSERALAREFGITYQHSHVVLDSSGNVVKKEIGDWSKEKIINELTAATGA